MHELSIAISLIEVAAEELERQGGGRVEMLRVTIGALSGVVPEALASAFELASEQSPLAGARLEIVEVPVEMLCPACGCAREVESIQEMRCRVCGTASANVIRGRELLLSALEICNEVTAPIG